MKKGPWFLAGMMVVALAQAAGQGLRPAVFAGQFYTADPTRLAEEIDSYLAAAAPAAPPSGKIIGLIVPHAGYVYSGRTAAAAYALVRGRAIDTVVIIGPSHHVGLRGLFHLARRRLRDPARDRPRRCRPVQRDRQGLGFPVPARSFHRGTLGRSPGPLRPESPARSGHRPHRHGPPNRLDHPDPGRRAGENLPLEERPRRSLDGPVPFPAEGRSAGDRRRDGRAHPGRGHGGYHPQDRGRGEHHVRRRARRRRPPPGREGGPAPGRGSRPDRFVRLRRPDRRLSRRGRPLGGSPGPGEAGAGAIPLDTGKRKQLRGSSVWPELP